MLTDSVVERHETLRAGLPSLAHGHLETRFFAWPAPDGPRVIVSVFPVDAEQADGGLPDFAECIVIPVVHRADRRVPLGFISVERDGDRRSAIAFGLAHGAQEWHVHLLATDRMQRRDLANRLRSFHQAAIGTERA